MYTINKKIGGNKYENYKKTIEAIANKIWAELEKRHAEEDVCVYYNNKRIHKKNGKKVVETDINPHDYFSYAAEKHILSMSFEGYEIYKSGWNACIDKIMRH